jgi:hypothetical protein
VPTAENLGEKFKGDVEALRDRAGARDTRRRFVGEILQRQQRA